MTPVVEILVRGTAMGVAAAALMDLWGLLLRRGFGIPTLDYALLGRWLGHMTRGRLRHQRIATAEPIPAERPLGYLAHYGIGVAFAVLLLLLVGLDWARSPTIWPALAIGIGTIAAPWLVMQPGMGAGIAGSKTPNPGATRLRNLATHAVYGIGLFLSAAVLSSILT
ncbi:MAG TPA: DUF2938 domain-containing protein [Candidatus Limnocylindrales bacterium]|nr:DUF2938 domain-containing protein [Candidatus Limnocylindrales bacterium]